jgi:acyl-CoA thioesterase I
VGGATVADNLARFERDLLAARPDLVIWQVGTNNALTGMPPKWLRSQLLDGIARVRVGGADIVLMDPQPLPQSERETRVEEVRAVLAATARAAQVPLLPRHELMRYWLTSRQLGAGSLLGADGLHMTDASYRCLAERVADLLPAPSAPARPEGTTRLTQSIP